MWPDIRRYSASFDSAVLTGVDAGGFPFSIRCTPQFDDQQQVIRLEPVAGIPITAGQAGMLFHKHNEQLWDLKMFLVLGRLEQTDQTWVFRPERLLPGGGMNAWQDLLALWRMRKTAHHYLAKRGLARPGIPWERIRSFYPAKAGFSARTVSQETPER